MTQSMSTNQRLLTWEVLYLSGLQAERAARGAGMHEKAALLAVLPQSTCLASDQLQPAIQPWNKHILLAYIRFTCQFMCSLCILRMRANKWFWAI